MGLSAEMKASETEAVAMGMARRATHLMPQRLTKLNLSTMAMATASTGNWENTIVGGRKPKAAP